MLAPLGELASSKRRKFLQAKIVKLGGKATESLTDATHLVVDANVTLVSLLQKFRTEYIPESCAGHVCQPAWLERVQLHNPPTHFEYAQISPAERWRAPEESFGEGGSGSGSATAGAGGGLHASPARAKTGQTELAAFGFGGVGKSPSKMASSGSSGGAGGGCGWLRAASSGMSSGTPPKRRKLAVDGVDHPHGSSSVSSSVSSGPSSGPSSRPGSSTAPSACRDPAKIVAWNANGLVGR